LGDYLAIDPHVRGHFDKPTDRFDPRKGHSVSFTIKPGRKLNLNKAVGITRRIRAGQFQLPYVFPAA
jgi:hypothetical protein